MRSAKLYRYRLPMDSGVILRQEKLTEREGFILELQQDGKTGRGEVAPLITFNLESVEEAGIQVQEQLALWCKGEEINYDSLYPSVAFGLSAALMELNSELPQAGNFFAAPLGSGDPDDLIVKLNAMPEKKSPKLKSVFMKRFVMG